LFSFSELLPRLLSSSPAGRTGRRTTAETPSVCVLWVSVWCVFRASRFLNVVCVSVCVCSFDRSFFSPRNDLGTRARPRFFFFSRDMRCESGISKPSDDAKLLRRGGPRSKAAVLCGCVCSCCGLHARRDAPPVCVRSARLGPAVVVVVVVGLSLSAALVLLVRAPVVVVLHTASQPSPPRMTQPGMISDGGI
jgi:hypothetical protein